jgi:hypothetical protein
MSLTQAYCDHSAEAPTIHVVGIEQRIGCFDVLSAQHMGFDAKVLSQCAKSFVFVQAFLIVGHKQTSVLHPTSRDSRALLQRLGQVSRVIDQTNVDMTARDGID